MKKTLVMMVSLIAIGWTQAVRSQSVNAMHDGSLLLLSPMAMVSSGGAIKTLARTAVKACRLLPAGFVGEEWKKFRISSDRKVVGGANSLDDLADASESLRRQHICEFRATAKCRLTEEGYAGEVWRRVRLELNDQVIMGADHFSEIVPVLEQIMENHFCQITQQECELTGEGPVGGIWQKHRITLDGVALFGAQDLGQIFEQSVILARLGICTRTE